MTVVAPPSTQLFLTIHQTAYAVRPLPCDDVSAALKAFRLRKSDGTLYDVAQTPYGLECDCPDFVFRRAGLDPEGCKHVRALVANGLLPKDDVPRSRSLHSRR